MAGRGRPPGSSNQQSIMIKQKIIKMLDTLSDEIPKWIMETYKNDGAKEATKLTLGFMDYAVPKLQRTELTGSMTNTNQVQIVDDLPKLKHDE